VLLRCKLVLGHGEEVGWNGMSNGHSVRDRVRGGLWLLHVAILMLIEE
jgi:hypothetical protein